MSLNQCFIFIRFNFRYHSAPSSEPVIHIYDHALPGYLEVIDSQSENEDKESDETSTNTLSNAHIYEDIDHVD